MHFRVKLIAANYIPYMTVVFPPKSGPNLAARSGHQAGARRGHERNTGASASAVLFCAEWEPGKGTTAAICGFVATIGVFLSRHLRMHGNMRAMSLENWNAIGEARGDSGVLERRANVTVLWLGETTRGPVKVSIMVD
jgi:hypothetical protein